MLSSKLAQARGCGAHTVCKHTARIEIGAASKQTQAVKQACTRLKTARGFEGAAPPIASTMLAEVPDEGADLARLREQESCSFLGILGGPKKQIHYRGVDLKFV